jgi:pimeloyl-ACP methyl ester carboxylesterase
VIQGDEEGTTTIIVSGGHLGGVANVGFEVEDEENGNETVDGITITNASEVQTDSSIISPSNVQPEIVTTSSISSTLSNSPPIEPQDTEHSADAGYRRIRNLPEAVSEAINDQDESEHENLNNTAQNGTTDPLQTELKWYETAPQAKPNGNVQNVIKPTATTDSKPLMFFIHGVGGSANTWITQLSYFSDSLGYECVATDLLGHGFSSSPDKSKSYTFKKLLRDTFVVFDHFTATSSMNMNPSGDEYEAPLEPRSCVVIGHSYGCAIAASLAKQRPDHVKMLIMVACGGPTPLTPPTGLSSLPPSFMSYCVKPFLKCGAFLQHQKEKAAGNANGNSSNMATTSAAASVAARRGKNDYFKNTLDIPAYVLHHVLMGQSWPEGKFIQLHQLFLPQVKFIPLYYKLEIG